MRLFPNASSGGARTVAFSLLTRRAAWDLLVFIFATMLVLLTVAIAIDIADELDDLRFHAEQRGMPLLELLLPYLGYRAVDIVTRLLPVAVFFGVFLAEIFRRLRLETVIQEAAGAGPIRQMAAPLWVALILGALQGGLEAQWRPAAVWAQVELGVGHYGRHFREKWITPAEWFISDSQAIRGTFLRGPNPEMRDVLVYSGIRQKELEVIYHARRVTPTDSSMQWQMQEVTRWSQGDRRAEEIGDRVIEMQLIPEALQYFKVEAYNLPTAALLAFEAYPAEQRPPEIQTAIWRRRTAYFVPGALAIFAMSLARRGFDGRLMNIPRLIGLGALGYVVVVSIKAFWAVGSYGAMHPALAAVFGIVLGLGVAAIVSVSRIGRG